MLRFALPAVLMTLAFMPTASASPPAPSGIQQSAPDVVAVVDVRVQKQMVIPRSKVRTYPAVRRQSTARQHTPIRRQVAPRYVAPRYVAPRYRTIIPIRRHYVPGGQYRSAPRGWHQYGSRPGNWQTRGCILVKPFWYCP